ncbi:hypothetical protein CYLTODRAFT_426494 [Cylindrobasidium torrendii FP15055 ss-10]|uniref:protein-tyrosine-phosphatase n=1 Tax=Cylindrobasidium torrendii FP15055 ss-10 TaxID=1314674 RepID=A0A0D7AYB7_9AGAR|nr:hypothetical protein CYLTODRAFT_426494 [Cylindrobasidium torrendii FP15055 ss-10]
MDFFSAAQGSTSIGQTELNSFADAINTRFDSFTARLPASPLPKAPPVKTAMKLPTAAPASPDQFQSMSAGELDGLIRTPSVLFIDVRPHAAFTTARLPGALSLSVPSTLLKRPMFSLERLAAMLSSQPSRARFLQWDQAAQIVVYDADSSALAPSSNILGLLRKFVQERPDYPGKLYWLRGGFQSVWRDRRDLVDATSLSPDGTVQAAPTLQASRLPSSAFRAPKRSSPAPGSLRSSMSFSNPYQAANPFFDAVRQNIELSHGITERIPLRLPDRVKGRIDDLPFSWLRDIARRSASSHDVDIEESMEALAMQFYRIELAEQRRLMGVMEHHSRESQMSSESSDNTHAPNVKPFPFSITAGVEKGTKNRYRHIWPFEHARVRLHNDRPASPAPRPNPSPESHTPALFPFPTITRPLELTIPPSLMGASSQTAAPFATSVPLVRPTANPPSPDRRSADDDYVNASFVQPICTRRRYIATQGPLEATFNDFWTLVWQQNVHVIVMLTREIEGSSIKCHRYWKEGNYGPLRLKLESIVGEEDPGDMLDRTGGGFFNMDSGPPRKIDTLVKRTFILTHSEYPKSTPRRITHFQYLGWPDMNVPDDARGLLSLMDEVTKTIEVSQGTERSPSPGPIDVRTLSELDRDTGVARRQLHATQPLLLHCSAGVGRTGGFIAIDAVLDAVRQELRKSLRDVPRELTPTSSPKDSDGDIVMDDTGRPAISMPPNREGAVLHIPVVEANLPVEPSRPSIQDWIRSQPDDKTEANGRYPGLDARRSSVQASTQEWVSAQAVEPDSMTGVQSTSPSSSRADHTSTDTADPSSSEDSSEDSSFGFNRRMPKLSLPNPPVHSGYSSSLTTNSSNDVAAGGKAARQTRFSLDSPHGPKDVFARRGSAPPARPTLSGDPSFKTSPPTSKVTAGPSIPSSATGSSRFVSPPPASIAVSEIQATTPAAPRPAATTPQDQNTDHVVDNSPGDLENTNIDYKDPRAMHKDLSPPLLSSYQNPLCEVVQDMREQRMSLCQSLRQYVFVHSAVIEGALQIVDEERKRAGMPSGEVGGGGVEHGVNLPSKISDNASKGSSSSGSHHESSSQSRSFGTGEAAKGTSDAMSVTVLAPALTISEPSSSLSGKRRASPTELPQENAKGEKRLNKRPSMKRKSRSNDAEGDARLSMGEDNKRLRSPPRSKSRERYGNTLAEPFFDMDH